MPPEDIDMEYQEQMNEEERELEEQTKDWEGAKMSEYVEMMDVKEVLETIILPVLQAHGEEYRFKRVMNCLDALADKESDIVEDYKESQGMEACQELPRRIEIELGMRNQLLQYEEQLHNSVLCCIGDSSLEETSAIYGEVERIDKRLGKYYAEEVCGMEKE